MLIQWIEFGILISTDRDFSFWFSSRKSNLKLRKSKLKLVEKMRLELYDPFARRMIL